MPRRREIEEHRSQHAQPRFRGAVGPRYARKSGRSWMRTQLPSGSRRAACARAPASSRAGVAVNAMSPQFSNRGRPPLTFPLRRWPARARPCRLLRHAHDPPRGMRQSGRAGRGCAADRVEYETRNDLRARAPLRSRHPSPSTSEAEDHLAIRCPATPVIRRPRGGRPSTTCSSTFRTQTIAGPVI